MAVIAEVVPSRRDVLAGSSALMSTVSLRSGATQARAEDANPAPGQLWKGERVYCSREDSNG